MACHHWTSTRACAGPTNANAPNKAAMNATFLPMGSPPSPGKTARLIHLYFYHDICVEIMKEGRAPSPSGSAGVEGDPCLGTRDPVAKGL
ncbi:hypothetical protein TM239_65670 [Bradyrhizobium sp. TM239]|nr:hypothetical protein TM239_65670 [Bradyrhizobium sp. TM239]